MHNGFRYVPIQKIYIGSNHSHRNITGSIDIKQNGKPIEVNFNKISFIVESFAYWRKANAIHKWFVDNVQYGNDDCRDYLVYGEKLIELRKLCRKVLKNKEKAQELLPTCDGFFFGETEYNDDYFSEIKNTIRQLKDVKEGENYVYASIW